jgi:hypothetical protein
MQTSGMAQDASGPTFCPEKEGAAVQGSNIVLIAVILGVLIVNRVLDHVAPAIAGLFGRRGRTGGVH